MKLDDSQIDEPYYPTGGQRIDKTIGYVVLGLVVVMVFVLFVSGLNRLQTVSDQAVNSESRPTAGPAAEISESTESPKD